MANKWTLSADLVSKLNEARAELDDEHTELLERVSSASERWQDSDRGVEVSAWLDGIETILDALDTLEAAPGD